MRTLADHRAPRRLAAIAIATTATTATMLVPIDIGRGVVLTAVSGIVGKLVYDSLHGDGRVERAR